jgi:hypothetical protein
MIVEAPWYMQNAVNRRDLQIPTVIKEMLHCSSQYNDRLSARQNDLAVNFMKQPDNRRLR